MKTEDNQFVQLCMVIKHDYERDQDILTECSQKQLCCQHHIRNSKFF